MSTTSSTWWSSTRRSRRKSLAVGVKMAPGRPRLGLGQDQRQRRRHRAGPSGRPIGRAHRRHPAARDEAPRQPLRRGHHVRRRRAGRRRWSWNGFRAGDQRTADCVRRAARRCPVTASLVSQSTNPTKGGTDVIFKAGVVGAGTMGGEIAQVISFSGLPVVHEGCRSGDAGQGHGDHPALFTRAGWTRAR